MNLGTIDRIFSNNDIFEMVYCWIGSLKIDQKYFVLPLDRFYYVLKPSDSVLKAGSVLNYPVCGKKQETSEIEAHAARSADANYIEVFNSKSETSNVFRISS